MPEDFRILPYGGPVTCRFASTTCRVRETAVQNSGFRSPERTPESAVVLRAAETAGKTRGRPGFPRRRPGEGPSRPGRVPTAVGYAAHGGPAPLSPGESVREGP
ncbi:hypothetical protein SCA03_00090 [Streptomyces cacaoi]|uniref:Uncharacterized protein n=1 Tax=Streptomyces cacaoi TaxID=1898 RepID=A0A4Y3QSS9_STRCI|nr:hypothetical protein SCA03_00090 [Streptomyces cacaoi]